MTQDIWDPSTYTQYLELRTRPARDLLAAIPEGFMPKIVYDLGCGTGNSTALLEARFPESRVMGLDTSHKMLEIARQTYPQVLFVEHDFMDLSAFPKANLLMANASLQWIQDHAHLIPLLKDSLKPGGWIAIQMPNNYHAPTHQTIVTLLKNNVEWMYMLSHLKFGLLKTSLYDVGTYYDYFAKVGFKDIICWQTTYFQEMSKIEGILQWVKGSALRPIFSKLNEENQMIFERLYLEEIKKYYHAQENGAILMPFQRLFIVGRCPE
ncbi:MAG: methyltransferase domain-containing protein [Alphaproteobacteria bacterium]|nr:methyltransferase domain-containing protein [Alphaproteobacteria bacterium]